MRECGFAYLEVVFALFLMVGAMAAVESTLQVLKQKTADSTCQTTAYLLAKSTIEQWKVTSGDFATSTAQEQISGMVYTITMGVSSVSEIIDRCEVTIAWKVNGTGKSITLTAYRYTPKAAVAGFYQLNPGSRLLRYLFLL
ncbi:hypothetical protein PP175_18615 [Aneurinibacillus sp. Ricciae_BoGa-3]|uniref:type IV pilus modification PilV family protein n=1 Tax=Aneurinibacillus sp. Ricciae_BoGa-3 TaxID=3022697 RepID=UPI002340640F|nr:hypothetical protein [Aneurinibacillus sp. Ricciae_BoGa-3]WCK53349.1 hypothetical protein PP175_18615 [Aneurinibacillus sp. Ricciae_BoGa-3]